MLAIYTYFLFCKQPQNQLQRINTHILLQYNNLQQQKKRKKNKKILLSRNIFALKRYVFEVF